MVAHAALTARSTPISHANRRERRRASDSRATLAPMSAHPPADAHPAHVQGAGELGWSALHGGLTPSGLVRLWLHAVQRLARLGPVARVPPDVLSVAGVAAAGGAVAVAAQGGRWPLAAAALVVLAGVLDGLDGAVALHTGRARPLGAVVDAVADRLGDLLLVATLAVLGAPPAWCVAAAALTMLHEYTRARAGAAGMPGVGRGDRRRAADPADPRGCRLSRRRRPARRHTADGLGLGDGVRGRLGRGRRRRTRPPVGRGGRTPPIPRRPPGESGGADEVGHDLRRERDDREPATRVRRPADEEQPRHG